MRLDFLPSKHSIGTKIFAAFVAMGLITGVLGGYGLYVLGAAGDIVVDTYDRPLMAINFARAASLDFSEMDKEVLRHALVPASARAAVDLRLAELTSTFFEDLAIAEQRSLAADERSTIGEIRRLVTQWNAVRRGKSPPAADGGLDGLAEEIVNRFDTLIELTADHSFVERRKAVWSISYFEYTSIVASALALLLSAAITLLLARRIVRPLSSAATIADRISGGELETPIPVGGKDETGILLRSMTIMQDNIRVMMEREKAQRQSAQNRLIDALESSREGMVLVDSNGLIVVANSQLATFFPTVAPQIVAGAEFAAAFAHIRREIVRRGDLDDAARAGVGRGVADSLSSDGEYQLTDGRWIRFSRSDTQDGGFFLFLSDFTEIKEREESFRDATKQAEAASKAKSKFLANMSHELRTPLNAIIGFSEILSGQLFGELGNQQYLEYSSNILSSGRHLLEIINSVLDLAKTEAGNLQITADVVDLGEILQSCAGMMREQAARAELQFDVGSVADPLPVLGEPVKLRQIFLNLLSNAVKFTESGGRVSLNAAASAGGLISVEVADTGIGMSPADIPVALAPFGQVDSRLARRYDGTGLGLPLAKAFTELHGGTMAIESTPGTGTKVTISLMRQHVAEAESKLRLATGL